MNREKSELINNFVAIVTNLFEEQKKTFSTKFLAHLDPSIKWDSIDNIIKINLYRIISGTAGTGLSSSTGTALRAAGRSRRSGH